MGFRYRKNWPALPGKPDIVFLKERVAVFCDGDFWHGKNWSKQQRRLKKGANAPYWVAKIKANMQRDTRYNTQLEKLGWLVVRLWDSDIHKDINQAVTAVSQAVLSRRVPA